MNDKIKSRIEQKTWYCVKPSVIILGDNKQIADLQTGNQAFGLHGTNTVKETFCRPYKGKLVRIRPKGMLSIETTPEHPILVRSSIKKWNRIDVTQEQWKDAKDLNAMVSGRDGDYVIMPIIQGTINDREINLSKYMKIASETPTTITIDDDMAWVMGLYIAEGSSDGGRISFSLGKHESYMGKKIVSIFATLGFKAYAKQRETTLRVEVYSVSLSKLFDEMFGHGAASKKIPDIILLHKNLNILQSLLDGYADGDGYVNVKSNVLEMGTISKTLALQLQLAYARLGYFVSVYERPVKHSTGIILGRVVNLHTSYIIRKYLTSPNYNVKVFDNYFLVPIKNIDTTNYNGNVYNIETADNTYIVSNAVVHNCVHGHTGLEHPRCWEKYVLSEPALDEKLGFLDIETSNLDGDFGIMYCLSPNTKILMSDLSWKEANNLNKGDKIIGVDEYPEKRRGATRKLRYTTIEDIATIKEESFRIETNDGEITASALHKFLVRDSHSGGVSWKETQKIKIGDSIVFLVSPWIQEQSFDVGWLSGIFDGEGSLVLCRSQKEGRYHLVLGFGQKEGVVLDKGINILKKLGIHYFVSKNKNTGCCNVTIEQVSDVLKVLGMCRPERLLPKVESKIINQKGIRRGPNSLVKNITSVGKIDVIALKTGTQTLIANGFISHNSWAIKTYGKKEILSDRITRKDLDSFAFDQRVVKSLVEAMKGYKWLSTYYGTGFDIPFSRTRALKWGIEYPHFSQIKHIDMYYTVKSKLKMHRNRLENAADLLGYEGIKTHLKPNIWAKAGLGDEASLKYILDHNIKDVLLLEKVFIKMQPYMKIYRRSI